MPGKVTCFNWQQADSNPSLQTGGHIRFFKSEPVAFAIERFFREAFQFPFTAVGVKEVAAINMDTARHNTSRVGDRMDDVLPEGATSPGASDLAPATSILPSASSDNLRQKMLSSRPQ